MTFNQAAPAAAAKASMMTWQSSLALEATRISRRSRKNKKEKPSGRKKAKSVISPHTAHWRSS